MEIPSGLLFFSYINQGFKKNVWNMIIASEYKEVDMSFKQLLLLC